MGNTSISDVGSLMGNAGYVAQMAGRISSQTSGINESSSPSFESVLNAGLKQSADSLNTNPVSDIGKDLVQTKTSDYQKSNSDRIAGEDKADAGKTTAADNRQKSKVGEKDQNKTDETGKTDRTELSDEDMERAGEETAAAASQLYEKVLDMLGISKEDGDALLAEMGIEVGDLLDKNVLSDYALQAMGAEDSLSLLTNESQYEQFQNIMSQLTETLNADSSVEGLSIGDLAELENTADDVTKVPVLNESGEDISAEAEAVTGKDGNSLGAQAMLRSERHNENGGNENAGQEGASQQLFSQQDFNAALQNVTETVSDNESLRNAQDIANQIMDYIRSNVKADTQSLEMQLHPASLGNVQINLVNKGGNISASFIAQNEQVKAALEGQMITLQQRFEEQGMKVTSIEVSVAPHSFEQNMQQQEQSEAQQEAGQPQRIRRLNLGELGETADLSELEEEDRIAAEMMTANGGTVDLQA